MVCARDQYPTLDTDSRARKRYTVRDFFVSIVHKMCVIEMMLYDCCRLSSKRNFYSRRDRGNIDVANSAVTRINQQRGYFMSWATRIRAEVSRHPATVAARCE